MASHWRVVLVMIAVLVEVQDYARTGGKPAGHRLIVGQIVHSRVLSVSAGPGQA
jgi:hypothetical protein